MLDINKIRENKNEVEQALLKRLDKGDFNLDKIISLDDERKELIKTSDDLKSQRNQVSKTKPTPEIIASMKKVGQEIKELDDQLAKVNSELQEKLAALPNLPAAGVVAGGKETANPPKTSRPDLFGLSGRTLPWSSR